MVHTFIQLPDLRTKKKIALIAAKSKINPKINAVSLSSDRKLNKLVPLLSTLKKKIQY